MKVRELIGKLMSSADMEAEVLMIDKVTGDPVSTLEVEARERYEVTGSEGAGDDDVVVVLSTESD